MPRKLGSFFSRGFIDPLSLIMVGFLLLTIVVGTAVTTNKGISLNIAKYAMRTSEGQDNTTSLSTITTTKGSTKTTTTNKTSNSTGAKADDTDSSTSTKGSTKTGTVTKTSSPTPAICDCVYGKLTGSTCGASTGMACSVNATPKPTTTPKDISIQIGKTPSPTGAAKTTTTTTTVVPTPTPTSSRCSCFNGIYVGAGCGHSAGYPCSVAPITCEVTACSNSCAKTPGYTGNCTAGGSCICSKQKLTDGRNCNSDDECQSGQCYQTAGEFLLGSAGEKIGQKTCHANAKGVTPKDTVNILLGLGNAAATMLDPAKSNAAFAETLINMKLYCASQPLSAECMNGLYMGITGMPEVNTGMQYFAEVSSVYLQGSFANTLDDTLSWGSYVDDSLNITNIADDTLNVKVQSSLDISDALNNLYEAGINRSGYMTRNYGTSTLNLNSEQIYDYVLQNGMPMKGSNGTSYIQGSFFNPTNNEIVINTGSNTTPITLFHEAGHAERQFTGAFDNVFNFGVSAPVSNDAKQAMISSLEEIGNVSADLQLIDSIPNLPANIREFDVRYLKLNTDTYLRSLVDAGHPELWSSEMVTYMGDMQLSDPKLYQQLMKPILP